jgi:hypothetical protein
MIIYLTSSKYVFYRNTSIGNRTASLHETINLFKKWTIVRPCFSPKADHVAHGFKKKKKEYKDDFF